MPSGPNRRNYYRILHVQPDAPGPVVKSSYRALMRSLEMHPDRGGDHWNAALVNEAYAVLSDPVKRAEYDRTLDLDRIMSGPHAQRPEDAEPPPPLGLDGPGCLFCGSSRISAHNTDAMSACPECRAPLTPAGAPQLEASGRRAAQRVSRAGRVRCYTGWPQATPLDGRIIDLSPRGMQFETDAPIDDFQIIKLEGPLLDAVARVATCRGRGRSYAIGVEFYTVHFHLDRGTFLSTSA